MLTDKYFFKVSAAKKDTFEVTEVEMNGAKVFFLENEAGVDLETQITPDTEVHIYYNLIFYNIFHVISGPLVES